MLAHSPLALGSPQAITPLEGFGAGFGAVLGTAPASMDIDFGRPLRARVIHLSSGWGTDDRHHKSAPHSAIDMPQPSGTPILAIQRGTVTKAVTDPSGDAGRYVVIAHDQGWFSRSLHMSKVLVQKGQQVAKGQVIGHVGNTGNSAGPHLHLDLWLDPELLPRLERDVGHPVGGYPTQMAGRTAVPGEPWIPVDSYDPGVVRRAHARNVPLYRDRHHGGPAERADEGGSAWEGMGGVFAVVGAGAGAVAVFKLITVLLSIDVGRARGRLRAG